LNKGQRWSILNRRASAGSPGFLRVDFYWSGVMAISKNDKHKEYAHYAAHCLEMVPGAPDEDFCAIQREMAAEWLKLADAALHPAKADDMI
jgi:hypothetical protein